MNCTQITACDQAAYRCAGCGTNAPRAMAALRDGRGHMGFLCPPCEGRYDDSTVFQRIVHSCIRCRRTVPEHEAMFAAVGLSIPTTAAAGQAAPDRVIRGH